MAVRQSRIGRHMLVLTRKVGDRILIGDDIVLTVVEVRGDSVRVGIEAPRGVKIQRHEIVDAVAEANAAAAVSNDDAENSLKGILGLSS